MVIELKINWEILTRVFERHSESLLNLEAFGLQFNHAGR